MAGIEDLVTLYRGEPMLGESRYLKALNQGLNAPGSGLGLTKKDLSKLAGQYYTKSPNVAASYAGPFGKIKSMTLPSDYLDKFSKFQTSVVNLPSGKFKQAGAGGGSNYLVPKSTIKSFNPSVNYGQTLKNIASSINPFKGLVDEAKIIKAAYELSGPGAALKDTAKLAGSTVLKSLSTLGSLPVSAGILSLTPTTLNEDEEDMTYEDYRDLAIREKVLQNVTGTPIVRSSPDIYEYVEKEIFGDEKTKDQPTPPTTGGGGSPAQMAKTAAETRKKDLQQMRGPIGRDDGPSTPTRSQNVARTASRVGPGGRVRAYGLKEGGRVGYALGSPEPLNVSNEEKRIAFDLYQALKDIEEQYTGETIAGDPSPQNLDPSDRRQGTLMAGGDFPEFETYADVIDAYNSGVAVEPGESLTDYIKRNNIKIKEIEMDPLGDLKKVELVDELEPGPLKDELLKDFDPSQETYEEYLQRKNLDRPFNAQDGGRVLAREGFGGGIEAQKKGTAASVAAFKAREVDRIRPTFYDGKLDIKGPEKLIEQYKIDFAKRLKFPKGGSEYKKAVALGEILSDADLAKKYNITIGDVERVNRVVKRDLGTYAVPDKKRYKTGVIRREELEKVTDLGLEQEYTKLKKGERIGNPDLAHRVSKKYNVTTSNLGLDNPLINRVIVKPNERDISRLYDKRIKIENKYKLKDGTFKKPSKKDIKILEQINNDVETLARETKGRLSAVVNDPKNLNKPYGSLGVDASKTIGGGVIDVDLKDVRKLPLEDQAFLKANLLELKNKELGKTPEMLADEFKDVLNKPDVQKRIENIISKGNMEKPYVDQAKKLLNIGKTVARPLLRVAAPFIPVLGAVGVGLGAADVAKAAEFTKKPDELGLAYLLGPEKAKDYSEFKESVRGKADETEEFVP